MTNSPIAALCPSCGASLSEVSVLALAPICAHCGVVITSVGGTLGLTSAYGLGDASITKRRVEADLAVLREYGHRYTGMMAACTQQLEWSAERYAKLPNPPELLQTQKTNSAGDNLGAVLILAVLCKLILWTLPFYGFPGVEIWLFGQPIVRPHNRVPVTMADADGSMLAAIRLIIFDPLKVVVIGIAGLWVFRILSELWSDYRNRATNGTRPRENERRQRAFEDATRAEMKLAETRKAAEDHRLRIQIRELEGLARSVAAKEADVRRILTTL